MHNSLVHDLNAASNTVKYVSSIILLPIGLIGNLIVFTIYTRNKFRSLAMARYLACLAIFNIIATTTLVLTIGKFEWRKTALFCKIYTYIRYTNIQFCSWLLVLTSIDRLFSIYDATGALTLRFIKLFITNIKFQVFVTTLIFILLLGINVPFLVFSTYYLEFGSCGLPEDIGLVIDIIDMLVSTVIPFLIMFVSSILIIKLLFKSRKRVAVGLQMSISTTNIINTTSQGSRDLQFAKTVIILNLLFLVCNLPICILLIIWNYYSFRAEISELMEAQLNMCYSIFSMLIYCYSALPFFVYLKVNSIFRNDFIQAIKKLRDFFKIKQLPVA